MIDRLPTQADAKSLKELKREAYFGSDVPEDVT